MLRKTGSSTGFGVSARPGPVTEPEQARRPWEPGGSVAVDVLVEWALARQRAGDSTAGLYQLEAEADGIEWQNRTMLSQVEQIAALGCRIDVSSGRSAAVHPAADAVAAAVRALPGGERIAHAARWGMPNGWAAPVRWLAPERWDVEGGRAMWCYVERTQGAHCPLIRVGSDESVALARDEYRAWWDALKMLAWVLAGRALGFIVEGPGVAREPWLDGPHLHC